MTFVRYWGPVCGYAGLIFYLSSQPHPEQDLPSFLRLFSDKILHAIQYAVLAGLGYRAFRWGTNESWSQRAVPLAILLASLYGISDEVHQAFVPFRDASWHDWLADTAGATLGAVTMPRMLSLWPTSRASGVLRQR